MSKQTAPFNPEYVQPRGEAEAIRLNNQSRMLAKLAGGLVMPEALSASSEREKCTAVLDAACGTGAWLSEVEKAGLFPNAEFHGVDISEEMFPLEAEAEKKNMRFKVQDLTMPLEDEYQKKFDLINIRLTFIWIKEADWGKVLANLFKALKPGGWIQIIECNFPTVYFPLDCKGERCYRLVWYYMSERNGSSHDCLNHLPSAMSSIGFDNLSKRTALLQTGDRQIDPDLRKDTETQLEAYLQIPAHGNWMRKNDDEWIERTLPNGEKVRDCLPTSQEEWLSMVREAMVEGTGAGYAYDVNIITAQRSV